MLSPEIHAALAAHKDSLKAYPNVVDVGLGYKTKNGLLFYPSRPELSDLVLMEPGKGYWLNVSRNGVLSYKGRHTPLTQGWNLIGWPPA